MRRVIPMDEADDEAPRYLPRRRGLGAWLVAIVMLGALVLLGLAADRRYHVVDLATRRGPHPNKVDPRVESFLADGERALAEGDLDLSQGDFDKASVLTERDPRVVLGQARVAAAKADIPWLKIRLLPPDAVEDVRTTRSQLDERVAAAQRTADEALSVAPQDVGAFTAKLDALRLAGDVDAARGYVVAVFARASQPETAYVLAALDLAQPGPPLPAVVDRLRLAAAGTPPGRARAALVCALARSGDIPAARTELSKLDAAARPYPLLPELHAWLGAEVRPVTPAVTPVATPPVEPVAPAASGSSPSAPLQVLSPRSSAAGADHTLQAAGEAINDGDFERAERIYEGILATKPSDSQALTGLAGVLRMRHDPQGAIDAYRRAIASNPSYVPAAVGLADTQWAQGDRAGAVRSYKNVVDHFPEGTYPGYVNQRAAGQ